MSLPVPFTVIELVIVLRSDEVAILLSRETYGRHLANTIERSVLGGDAGCRYRY